ncbi:MAG: M1 family aminopeptidase [Bacteroidota bacterium]
MKIPALVNKSEVIDRRARFPTIDKPNQRCTQEIYVTVADKYETLSNGLLISSTKNEDGTRTDYWKMDLPHAPYLFMLAIGEFAVIEDTWQGRPVNYYVEPEYEADARAIFPHTPEMLTFFSEILGFEYPWSKYSQVIVRDYVSGAMENTTGVIYGEFLQHTERELIDELINDKIGAHELFHHWFGDLVTCESWANLTLQEGFANYSEYLWLEYKYGRDEADYHLLEEWSGYLSSAEDGIHPLIHYGYGNKEEMFDAHSYNKGGAVLHMLRHTIGDDAFFASLKKYLEDNAYSEVEVAELRMAFEETTGQDLHWFFDQWYLESGHPTLDISYDYDEATKEAIVNVKQTQNTEDTPPIFQLFAYVDVYLRDQAAVRHQVMMTEREQSFRFPANEAPALVTFDAERAILGQKTQDKGLEELAYQLEHAPLLFDRYQALAILATTGYQDILDQALLAGTKDKFYGIRALALEEIKPERMNDALRQQVVELAQNDPHSEVRALAIELLAQAKHPQATSLATAALSARPYKVVAAGLTAVAELDPVAGAKAIGDLEAETNEEIVAAIGQIYASTNDVIHLPYFQKQLRNVDGFAAIEFFESYADLLLSTPMDTVATNVTRLRDIGVDQAQSPWKRLAAISALSHLRGELDVEPTAAIRRQLQQDIDAIKAAETNEQLRSIYQQF